MSAILNFNFQKKKQKQKQTKQKNPQKTENKTKTKQKQTTKKDNYVFLNYLNYTKKTQFCMWQLHFP